MSEEIELLVIASQIEPVIKLVFVTVASVGISLAEWRLQFVLIGNF